MNFKALALSALSALSIAAPASAIPIPVGNSWGFLPELTGSDIPFFVDVIRKDHEGDILITLTDEKDNRMGYAWVSCDDDQIQYDGGRWQYVDHRRIEGWFYEIACHGRIS